MNSTEASTTEWSSVPEVYEVEIKVSPKFADIVGNDTASNNDTFTFQGERIYLFFVFSLSIALETNFIGNSLASTI